MIINVIKKASSVSYDNSNSGLSSDNMQDVIDEMYESIGGKSLIDKVYPIGSVYISFNNVDPSTFIGGTWQQIQDVFLLAAGTKTAGTTGGEETHKLGLNEIPSHNHTFTGSKGNTANNSANHTHSIPSLSGTTNTTGSHTHTDGDTWTTLKGTNISYSDGGITTQVDWGDKCSTSSSGSHSHTVTTNAANTGANSAAHYHEFTPNGSISNSGGSSSHNNMPPYIAVYMWQRIG